MSLVLLETGQDGSRLYINLGAIRRVLYYEEIISPAGTPYFMSDEVTDTDFVKHWLKVTFTNGDVEEFGREKGARLAEELGMGADIAELFRKHHYHRPPKDAPVLG
jgi:hypothetical protein